MSRLPVATLALSAVVMLVALVPGLQRLLVFDRELVAAGQLWRIATGSLVHFSTSHLLFDLITVAAAAAMLERSGQRVFPVIAAAAIAVGAAVLLFAPELQRYGGLSGIAYTVVVLCALEQLHASGLTRAVAIGVLLLTVAKLTWDLQSGALLFVSESDGTLVPVPLAHLAGALVGAAAYVQSRLASLVNARASASAAGPGNRS